MPKLIMTVGISGCGKTSYIKKHFKPEIVVSPDDLRRKFTGNVTDHSQEGKVWAVVPKLLQQKLDKYGEAVLDATNVDSGSRSNILKKFNKDEVEKIAIIFKADPEESKRRIHADIESGKDRSSVPDAVVDKQQQKFLRGYNNIKQQFDTIIYADNGESDMSKVKKENIQKIRKIVIEEFNLLKEEDAAEAQERAQYQSYQDIYLVPQSNWKLKKYANMYDRNGNLYRGKLGEVHRIQTVEYDFMHTGEVVTECGDETYSLNAEDFRECFEMAHDEEGLKVNNESVDIREDVKKLVRVKNYFGKNIKESIERLEKTLLKEFEYEDSGGLMADPEEEDPYHQTKWTKVIPEFYYNDDFEEIELLILIYNDNNTSVTIIADRDNPGSKVLSFELATGKVIDIRIPKSEIDNAIDELVGKDFIDYDNEGNYKVYYLTDKGMEFCKNHNLYNSLRGVLDGIKEIDNSL